MSYRTAEQNAPIVALEYLGVAVLLFFAVWSVFTHTAIFTETTFQAFCAVAPWYLAVSLAAGVIGAAFVPGHYVGSEGAVARQPSRSGALALALAHGVVGVGLVAAYRATGSYLVFWVGTVLALGSFALLYGRSPRNVGIDDALEHRAMVSWGFGAALVAVVSYVVLLPSFNLDDSLYLNLIVGLREYGQLPMLRFDTLHGIEGLPAHNAVYLAKTLEPLQAVLADLLGVEPVMLRQYVFAPVSAIVSVTFLGLLFRRFLPGDWGLALWVFLALVFVWGVAWRMMGNFYFDYLSSGKWMLIAVILPAAIYKLADWFERGRFADWLMVTAIAVAGAGLTPNGIVMVPLAIFLFSLASFAANRDYGWRLVGAGLACAYPVVVVLLIKLAPGFASAGYYDEGIPIDVSLRTSLGWDWRYWAMLAVLVVGPVFLGNRREKTRFTAWVLVFFLVAGNPFFAEAWAKHVTGLANWRLAWAFPFLVLAAVFATAALRLVAPSGWRRGVVLVAVPLLALGLGAQKLVKAHDENPLPLFAPKVPQPEYALAQKIVAESRRDDVVLAPKAVAAYMVTLAGHPRPVVARPLYTYHSRNLFAPHDLERRFLLYWLVAPEEADHEGGFRNLGYVVYGRDELDARLRLGPALQVLRNELSNSSLQTMLYREDSKWAGELDGVLRDHGYRRSAMHGYAVWHSPGTASPGP